MSDVGEIQKAVGYAGFGAVVLKGIEIFLKSLNTARHDSAKELELTLEAAAKMREDYAKDNESLRERIDKLEARLASLEDDYQALKKKYAEMEVENISLKAKAEQERKDYGQS